MKWNVKTERYHPLELLGAGNFARVYLAFDKKLSRRVAIKVLQSTNDTQQLVRFEREAMVCKDLRHPNIIRIYDAVVSQSIPYIIMEFIEAKSLDEVIGKQQFSFSQVLSIGTQLGSALSYLHSQGILHRDIKPANVIIDDAFRPVLMDFNLAFSDDMTQFTQEGFVVGTPRFMAPELFSGSPADSSSDIYSLGLVLHYLLTEGSQLRVQLNLATISSRVIAPPSHFNPSVPRDLDELVVWMTHADRSLRCPSADAFLEKIHGIERSKHKSPRLKVPVGKDPLPKVPVSKEPPLKVPVPKERSVKTQKRRPVAAAVLCMTLLLFAAIYGFASLFSRPHTLVESAGYSSHASLGNVFAPLRHPSFQTCATLFPHADGLAAFMKSEEEAYTVYRDDPVQMKAHVAGLRKALQSVPADSPFSSVLECVYRFRQRKGTKQTQMNGLSPFLTLAAKKYGTNLLSSPHKATDLDGLSYILATLFCRPQTDSSYEGTVYGQCIETFFRLPDASIHSKAGKRLFHILALVREVGEKDPDLRLVSLLLLPPDYDNEATAAVRAKALSLFQGEMSALMAYRKEYGETAKDFSRGLTKKAHGFLSGIDRTLKEVHALALQELRAGLTIPLALTERESIKKFGEYIDKCAGLSHTGKVWMYLSPHPVHWGRIVVAASLPCLRAKHFRIEYLFISAESIGTGESYTSVAFQKRMFRNWLQGIEAAVSDEYFQTEYRSLGQILPGFHSVLSEAKRMDRDFASGELSPFLSRVGKRAPVTALALTIVKNIHLDDSHVAVDDVARGLQTLLQKAKELPVNALEEWAGPTSILSNYYFLHLKKVGNISARLAGALQILKVIAPMYKASGGIFLGRAFLLGKHFSILDFLKISTVIHACDGAIEKGRSLKALEPELYGTLQVDKTLQYLLNNENEFTNAKSVSALRKLQAGLPVSLDEIRENPFMEE
jgi:serine/threonine protein kinase